MTFTILQNLNPDSKNIFYQPKFRAILEDHLDILRQSGVTINDIPLDLYWQYEGNFYGYLVHLNIPIEWHWLMLRVNGMHNPNEFAKVNEDPLDLNFRPVIKYFSERLVGDLQKYYMSQKF